MPDQKRTPTIEPDELPQRREVDWDRIESGSARPARSGPSGEALEEEDDNAFQHSDEALPSDEGEEAIAENPDRRPDRFEQ